MKRVLSLVLALVLVLGMVPVFANEVTSDALDLLRQYDVAKGDEGTGDLRLEDTLTRAEMVVLLSRMFGVEEDAMDFEGEYPFEDINDDQWWTPYIAYAFEQAWTSGKTATTFGPADLATGKEILIFAMRALGYSDFGLASAGLTAEQLQAEALEAGLAVSTMGQILRGEVFAVVYTTLFEVENVDGEILASKFFGWEAPVPVVTELEVTNVKATNLKTMVVEFNKPVDEETITSTTVKAVKGTTNVIETDGRLLSEDGMTLTIVYASSAVPQSTEVKLTIDGVKSVDGSESIDAYENSFMVNDVVVPEVLDVVALNAKQVEVFFSEPMNIEASTAFRVINNVKINNTAIIAKVAHNYRTNSVVFELNTALEAKEHSIEIKDMTDFATYKAITKTLTFVVVEDKAAPVMTNAVARSVNRIEVTFDETVAVQGSFWVNGTLATATPVANSNNTRFTLTGFPVLDLGAVIQVRVEYQNQEDVVGNKVATKQLFTFQVQDDTTMPTVEVKVEKGNKIVLTFSKAMLPNTGTIQILKSNKTAHSAIVNVTTFKANSNDTVLELLASDYNLTGINAGTYYVNIKGMKDATVRANLLPEQTLEIATLDTRQPEVAGGYSTAAGTILSGQTGYRSDETITFFFTEAMNVDSLKNLSNYRFMTAAQPNTGLTFAQISGVSFKSASADGKSVTITYPSATDLTTNNIEFSIYALTDVAGNPIVTKNDVAPLAGTFGYSTTAVAVAGDKIVVTFNSPMASVDPSFIQVKQGTEAFAVPVSATIGGTGAFAGREVTFTLNRSIGTATTGYTVEVLNKTLAKDIYGRGFVAADTPAAFVAITDEVRPVLTSITQKRVGDPAVAVPNQFVIKMSEAINAATITNLKNDLIVRYADGTAVAAGDYTLAAEGTDSILVTLDPNPKLSNGVNAISVQLFAERELADIAGNKAVAFAATTVNVTVDAVAPTVVTRIAAPIASIEAPTTHTLVFSEELSTASKAAVKAMVDGAYAAGGTAAFTSAWSGATLTVTISAAAAAPNNVVFSALTVAPGFTVTDLTGNESAVLDLAALQQ